MGNGVGTYFEASEVIVALVYVGQVLELRARERTGNAIRALLDLAPKTARRIQPDGTEYDAPLDNIMEGERLRVRPGDAVLRAGRPSVRDIRTDRRSRGALCFRCVDELWTRTCVGFCYRIGRVGDVFVFNLNAVGVPIAVGLLYPSPACCYRR